jgi:hypothetical protein
MSNDLFGVVAVLVVVGVGAVAFTPAYTSGSDRVTAVDSVTVDYSGAQSVSESGLRYADSVTVTTNNTTLEPGVDYRWNETAGNVSFANTTATTAGSTVDVEYQYREADTQQRTVGAVVESLGMPLVFLLFLMAGGYVFREVI